MDKQNEDVMVALLPKETNWCKIELPHTTLIYVGKIPELEPFLSAELTRRVSSLALLSNPIYLKVYGVEVFGDKEKVNVLRLESSPSLLAMRETLEMWDNSEFPIYKPHATIGPVEELPDNVPMMLCFDRIMVGWGNEKIIFSFKTSM